MLHRKVEAAPSASRIFVELRPLSWREQEVADIVDRCGVMTAGEIEEALGRTVSNATVRSTLNRLVEKRMLTRLANGLGAFVYAPAQTRSSLRDSALERFACDFHDGSLKQLADLLASVWATSRKMPASAGAGERHAMWRLHRSATQARASRLSHRRSGNEALVRCAEDFYAGSLERLADSLSARSRAPSKRRSKRLPTAIPCE